VTRSLDSIRDDVHFLALIVIVGDVRIVRHKKKMIGGKKNYSIDLGRLIEGIG
jgi:hypothetical protein